MGDTGTDSGRLLAATRWELRTILGRYPTVALPLLRARRGNGFLAPIRDETEVVIEGFPRSGNTFAVAAFHYAQLPRDVKIAHHAHVPAQLLSAVRLGLPAVVLVREPEECVLSMVVRDPALGVGGVLRGWLRFHEPLVAVRDRVAVASFAEATTDVAAIVRRVNHRFGTRFREFDPTRENVAAVRALIERGDRNTFGTDEGVRRGGGLPGEGRELLKHELRAAYRAEALARRRSRADELFGILTGPG